jgi:hypothetical protein
VCYQRGTLSNPSWVLRSIDSRRCHGMTQHPDPEMRGRADLNYQEEAHRPSRL